MCERERKQSKSKLSKAKQCTAKQSKAKQSKANHSKAKQIKAMHSKAKQSNAQQSVPIPPPLQPPYHPQGGLIGIYIYAGKRLRAYLGCSTCSWALALPLGPLWGSFLPVGEVLRVHMLLVTLPHLSCPQFQPNRGVLEASKTSIFIERVIIF